MLAWFKISELQSKVGIITDYFVNYIELKEIERGNYYIVHESKVNIIYKKMKEKTISNVLHEWINYKSLFKIMYKVSIYEHYKNDKESLEIVMNEIMSQAMLDELAEKVKA